MNKKTIRLIFCVFALFIFKDSFAQQKTILQGVVFDSNTNKPVPYASISIKNTSAGSITDAFGRFKINIAVERQTVIIVSGSK